MVVNYKYKITFAIMLLSLIICSLILWNPSRYQGRVVYVYNWVGQISPGIIEKFEKRTGIKVIYDVYESDEILDAKLFTGNSGYDVVFPSSYPYFARQQIAGIYLKLDHNKLPNTRYLDQSLFELIVRDKIDNAYCIPYLWGTLGIAYNQEMWDSVLPDTPMIDSWQVLFDLKYLEKLSTIRVSLMSSVSDLFPAMYHYLGIDHTSEDHALLHRSIELLRKIKPYISKIQKFDNIRDLASGNIGVAHCWSHEARIARDMAAKIGKYTIKYVIPREGSLIWADVMAIPKSAPHIEEAYEFINFMIEPEIIAEISEYLQLANINTESKKLLSPSVANDELIYPDVSKYKFYPDITRSFDFEYYRMKLLMQVIAD